MSEDKTYNIPYRAMHDDELSAIDLRVYCIVKMRVMQLEAQGKEFSPENISFAQEIGIHPRTLQKSLERLEKRDYIIREMRSKKRYIHA